MLASYLGRRILRRRTTSLLVLCFLIAASCFYFTLNEEIFFSSILNRPVNDEDASNLLKREIDIGKQLRRHLGDPDTGDDPRQVPPALTIESLASSDSRVVQLVKSLSSQLIPVTSPDADIQMKRDFVKKMMKTAWDGYMEHAKGYNELRPISRQSHSSGIFGSSKFGATIVDGLDTLLLMGLYDEYLDGRDWVAENLDFNTNAEVSLFEMTIRFVGGLLSVYSFTKDQVMLDKALQLTNRMSAAFSSPTGLPFSLVQLGGGFFRNFPWASGGMSILSEVGTLHLEYRMLSHFSKNPEFLAKVERIRDILFTLERPNGLFYDYIDPRTGAWGQAHVSLGALGDSFYEYLLKDWIITGKKNDTLRRMYDETIEAVQKHLVKTSDKGLTYLGVSTSMTVDRRMEHLACFAGGMFALGATTLKSSTSDFYLDLGKKIGKTCRESYNRTATGLGSEIFRFVEGLEALPVGNDKHYLLRPEVIETFFYLWRLTHDPLYRQWGWEAAQAIQKYCRHGVGYSGVRDVTVTNVTPDDVQQSYFLAETLKYLYLLFSDDNLVPLDSWVFNTEGHPLPVL